MWPNLFLAMGFLGCLLSALALGMYLGQARISKAAPAPAPQAVAEPAPAPEIESPKAEPDPREAELIAAIEQAHEDYLDSLDPMRKFERELEKEAYWRQRGRYDDHQKEMDRLLQEMRSHSYFLPAFLPSYPSGDGCDNWLKGFRPPSS
jgi:hypothetical protein